MNSCHPSAANKKQEKTEISLTFVCESLEKGFLLSNVASKKNSNGFLFGEEAPSYLMALGYKTECLFVCLPV